MQENMPNISPKSSVGLKYVRIALILAVVGSMAYFGNAYKTSIYKQLDDLHLIPRQEYFTELYFNNHTNLPKKLAKGVSINFSFAIRNLEGKDKEYPYIVYFKNDKYGTTTLDLKTVLVKDNEEKIINETYTFSSKTLKETLFVELTELNQEIHFALTKGK